MKNYKKIIASAMALAMASNLGFTAFAGEQTITVKGYITSTTTISDATLTWNEANFTFKYNTVDSKWLTDTGNDANIEVAAHSNITATFSFSSNVTDLGMRFTNANDELGGEINQSQSINSSGSLTVKCLPNGEPAQTITGTANEPAELGTITVAIAEQS